MKPGKYRYVVATLLFLAGAINYMDRAALGVVAPILNDELHLAPAQMGFIFSAFFVGYSLFAFVGGQLADRYGPHRVFSFAMGGWSLICGLTATATGFFSLLFLRTLFGFGEGPMNATTNRTITNWFPREETATMIGFTFSGQTVGSAIAGPVVGLTAVALGWRTAFVVIAALGLVWLVAWAIFGTNRPAENRRVGAAERELIESSRRRTDHTQAKPHAPLKSFLLQPSTLAVAAGLFAANYMLYVFISWMPSYFTHGLHLSVQTMSLVSVIPWLCGGVGYFGSGIVADILFKRMSNKLLARKLTAIVPLALSGISVLSVGHAQSTPVIVALVALAVMFLSAACQACWATIHELIPADHVGGVGGFVHLIANTSGIVGPALMGMAVQYLGGYDSGFLLGAAIDLLGVLAMLFFITSQAGRRNPAFDSSQA
ncbi:MFS transporter [Paraburkholderia sp. Ac-20347]|uniref:MFS transporter n=1 Tax=Paraburkholderia sp. Ac-20347 TaxID=2703892 RepID=UPI001980FAEF|nr:MFS transporter [Paraburkholderia sp. Ac-20347]MBN3809044.1 MFS transporter [Paraburkholderia sp. Ac-20347]